MSTSYGAATASSQLAFFPHLIADFQRALHSRLLSVVHSVSISSTAAPPLAVHQWLQEQLVACLDAEKRYILHSPPPPSLSPPPVAAPSVSPDPPAGSAPQQLSSALNELTLSAAEAINHANRQRQHMQQAPQQQQVQRSARRDEEHKDGDISDWDGAEDKDTSTYRSSAPTQRRSSLSRSHHRPHHHHHHGHAVEVSVRCLTHSPAAPTSSVSYPRPHSHDEDDESVPSRVTSSAYSHAALTSYTLSSTAVTTKREREELNAGTTRSASPPCRSPSGHSSYLSPLPCLPNCTLPPLSPCSSSSPCLDFNCLDPTPFSLCDDDPMCCFPTFNPADDAAGVAHAHHGAMLVSDGTTQYADGGDQLCSSPLSSVCLPMPCDPCAVSAASTTTTTTTTLLSCVPCDDSNCGEDDSNTPSPLHSPTKLDEDQDKQATISPPSLANQLTDSVDDGAASKAAAVNGTVTPRSASNTSTAAAASSSVMVSCHQCKLKKPSTQCMQCTCNEQKGGGGKKRCVKKYCHVCLSKH